MYDDREEVPKCYGKQWDDSEAACAGGRDPTYTDPETGSHVRERCQFFSSCGARLQANKMQQKFLPPQSLVRPPQAPVQQAPPQHMQLPQTQQIAQMQQLIVQLQSQLQNRGAAPQYGYQMQQPVQQMQPLQMMATEFSMPRYLTVPEPRGDTSIWSLLGREVARSMMKSMGHTLANFWDTTPIQRK